ncbi:MAG: hypothetical protein IKM36_03830, partial [Oscillospiraceae bacterium]|nr:hypothetical protein [Oscillospiraceae bacterium]
FVLFTFLFSFFSLLSNCRFQRKDKREEIKEKVALRRKALNYDFDCLLSLAEEIKRIQKQAKISFS